MAMADPHTRIFLEEPSTPTTLTPTGLGPGFQFTGALDRDAFDAFGEEVLVPTLLANRSGPKSAPARALIEAAGWAFVFLPPSSPDFNPIEQACATLKQALRRAKARTMEAILSATEPCSPQLTSADTRGVFRECGSNL